MLAAGNQQPVAVPVGLAEAEDEPRRLERGHVLPFSPGILDGQDHVDDRLGPKPRHRGGSQVLDGQRPGTQHVLQAPGERGEIPRPGCRRRDDPHGGRVRFSVDPLNASVIGLWVAQQRQVGQHAEVAAAAGPAGIRRGITDVEPGGPVEADGVVVGARENHRGLVPLDLPHQRGGHTLMPQGRGHGEILEFHREAINPPVRGQPGRFPRRIGDHQQLQVLDPFEKGV